MCFLKIEYLKMKLTLHKQFNMDHSLYIERNPAIMMGKPIIKGTRITVELIIRKFAGGSSIEKLLESYPHLSAEQIQAVFEYAADIIANEEIIEAA